MKKILISLLVLMVLFLGYKYFTPPKIISNNGTPICNIDAIYDSPTSPCTCPQGYTYKSVMRLADYVTEKYGCSSSHRSPFNRIVRTISFIIAPNGGEQIKTGSTYEIRWDPSRFGDIDKVTIYLKDESLKCPRIMAGCRSSFGIETTENDGSYLWDTSKYSFGSAGPDSYSVRPGSNYKISIVANSIQLKSRNTFSITP